MKSSKRESWIVQDALASLQREVGGARLHANQELHSADRRSPISDRPKEETFRSARWRSGQAGAADL